MSEPSSAPVPRPLRLLRITEQAILGGEQTDVLSELACLDRRQYAQTLCTEATGPLVDEARRLGIPCIPLALRGRLDARAIRRLRDIIRQGRYDIVHLHGARAGVNGRLAARLARAPLTVFTMHVYQPDVLIGARRRQRPFYLAAEWALARFCCDHVITVSDDLRRRAVAEAHIAADKVTTIYSGVDLAPFHQLAAHGQQSKDGAVRSALGLAPDAPVICVVGRLVIQKGIPDLLHAAAQVHAARPDVRFLIVGDGPERGALQALGARLGLNGSLIFTGFRRDVPELLVASDIFANPTHWEGMGKTNVEAMAAGKPIVSTDVGPIPEVLGDYPAAILTPPRDPERFAHALTTMLSDLPAYSALGRAGRPRAEAFGYDTMVARTAALYEQLLLDGRRQQ